MLIQYKLTPPELFINSTAFLSDGFSDFHVEHRIKHFRWRTIIHRSSINLVESTLREEILVSAKFTYLLFFLFNDISKEMPLILSLMTNEH